MRHHHSSIIRGCARLLLLAVALLSAPAARGQGWKQKFTSEKPLIIVCDWDKPPYEFLDRNGEPAGTNIESMALVFKEMGIPFKYVLKDWSLAIKMFELGQADVILANANRYRNGNFAISDNIINYNRICAASLGDSVRAISHDELLREGVVLKPGDYTRFFFNNIDSAYTNKVEEQSPKVALTGLKDGIYKYFVWGEEPLKWKIRELNLDGIILNDVQIPVSDIYIIGHEKELIEEIDDHFSRLKQSGEIQHIIDKWIHPDRVEKHTSPVIVFIIIGILLLAAFFYFFSLLAKRHVRAVTRDSSELNNMMIKALHMGNFDVIIYDIRHDLITNHYGNIVPEKGITLQEFISHIHPSEQEEFRQRMERLLSGRDKKFELNKRWRTFGNDSTWLYFQGHAILEVDSEGRPAYIINAVHDITHDEEKERDNRELVYKYACLSNIPFFAVSFYDRGGWLVDLNDSMKELCHISDSNPESRRYWDTVCMFDMPLLRTAITPGDRHAVLACMHMEYPELDINHYIEYELRPLFNAEGELANYVYSVFDVTDSRQHHTEMRQLAEEKKRLQQRIGMLRKWLQYLLRNSDRLLMLNDIGKQEIAFFRLPDAPEYVHQFDDFCNNYLIDADKVPFRRLLTDNRTHAMQSFTIHLAKQSEGQPGNTFELTFHPVTDAAGNIVGHEGISRDITAISTARCRLGEVTEQAKDSSRLKSGFMASMTHELRTPLSAIIGFTTMLQIADDPAERSEYVRIIRNSTDMLQRLINDIIEASSLAQSPTTIEPKPTDIAAAFDDIWLTLQQRVQSAGLTFIKDNPYRYFHTQIDRGRVQQVLTNFVTNAVKFTRQGHVRLGYRYQNENNGEIGKNRMGLYFYCEDTGIGIPADKQTVIFDRFVKLDEFVQGTGMGLNICKTIVECMNGHIGVSSAGPGQGSTFWFWIPCEKSQ